MYVYIMLVYISRDFLPVQDFTPKIQKLITTSKPSPITYVCATCGLTEVFKKTIFMTIFNTLIDANYALSILWMMCYTHYKKYIDSFYFCSWTQLYRTWDDTSIVHSCNSAGTYRLELYSSAGCSYGFLNMLLS